MHEVLTLLKIELLSYSGLSKLLHTKDQKEKRNQILLTCVWCFAFVIFAVYIIGIVYGLTQIGFVSLVPSYLTVLMSLIIIFFTVFTAGNHLFSKKNHDILISLPINTSLLVAAKVLGMYVVNLFYTMILILPGMLVYLQYSGREIGTFITIILILLFLPMIPVLVASAIGFVVMAVSSRMRHQNLVQTLLMVGMVVLIVGSSFQMNTLTENITVEKLQAFGLMMSNAFQKIYYPSIWVSQAIVEGKMSAFFLFAGCSLLLMAALIKVVASRYRNIMNRLSISYTKGNYRITEMHEKSVLKTLYQRELKRYFSSSVYVTNTIIGPIMGVLMAGSLCFAGMDSLQETLEMSIDLTSFLPFVFAAVFSIMPTTGSSISLEGKQISVLQSLPVSIKDYTNSKILMNLTILIPCYVISMILLAFAVRVEPVRMIWICLIPLVIMLFSVVFGLTINLKIHRFDWDNEARIVKQSLPATISAFAGMLISILFGLIAALLPSGMTYFLGSLLIMILTMFLYYRNHRYRFKDL